MPPKPSKFNALTGAEEQPITVELPGAAAPKEKQRYSETGAHFKAIDDNALQARIQRIGATVVPDYQTALPKDHPSKINFQFYAVDSQEHRSVICSNDGLILVPKSVLERLKTDDQLAALLADGGPTICNGRLRA